MAPVSHDAAHPPVQQFDGIDPGLFARHSRPGPRYTSYPTANLFTSSVDEELYRTEIARTNDRPGAPPVSLYVHVPFCDTLCYFCGCNMIVSRDRDKIASYLDTLIAEIDLLRPLLDADRPVEQIAWGGGTPTSLAPDEIRRLADAINTRFDRHPAIEAGVEIDPRELTREHVMALGESGFNRVSMGVQDFDPRVQEAVNRIQPEEITVRAIEWVHEAGIDSINLDLMYGLPYQTLATFERTLERTIAINPDRIAVFNYAHVPWLKKHMTLIKEEHLPTPDEKVRIFIRTLERLNEAGYVYVGMDHFAKPDNELAVAQREGTLYRNFQGYTTHAGADLFGLGMTGIGQFDRLYAQNLKGLPAYTRAVDEGRLPIHAGYLLSPDDIIRRDVIMSLMCDFRLVKRVFEERHDIVFDEYFHDVPERLADLVGDGLVRISDDEIDARGEGMLIIRNIAMAFDAHLPAAGEKPVFSRTV